VQENNCKTIDVKSTAMMTSIEFQENLLPIRNLLFAFAMKLTRNQEDAKDLMQETLMRAYGNLHRFQSGTNFKAWISTIMRNSFINNYRKMKTRKQVEKPVEDFLFAVESTSISDNAFSIIMHQELTNLVDRLDDGYKVPFLMYFQGYHYNEISQKMEIPMGTVKSRIFFARKKLKNMVKEQYGEVDFRRA
jgi:RNA polymerase sigma-70 factor (ECF subfamily)